MPVNSLPRFKVVKCNTCGNIIGRFDRLAYKGEHVPAEVILAATRKHYLHKHPHKFRQSIKKGILTKLKRGIIRRTTLDPKKAWTGTREEELYSPAERRPKELQRKHAHDPDIKVRKKLIDKPEVKSFRDYKGEGLIRVLHRKDKTLFPEFALYVKLEGKRHPRHEPHDEMLRNAGFTEDKKQTGKWTLRSDKFSVFLYV